MSIFETYWQNLYCLSSSKFVALPWVWLTYQDPTFLETPSPNSSLLPTAPLIGARLRAHHTLHAGTGLACACAGPVHAVLLLSSYMRLLRCVRRTMFSHSHLLSEFLIPFTLSSAMTLETWEDGSMVYLFCLGLSILHSLIQLCYFVSHRSLHIESSLMRVEWSLIYGYNSKPIEIGEILQDPGY